MFSCLQGKYVYNMFLVLPLFVGIIGLSFLIWLILLFLLLLSFPLIVGSCERSVSGFASRSFGDWSFDSVAFADYEV